jgi:LPS sulfotransferase NodH
MMWGYFGDFLSQMFSVDVLDSSAAYRKIQEFFPSHQYIWMRREDSLLQAISLWKAIQTQCWRMDVGDGRDRRFCNVSFSYEAIAYLQKALIEEDAGWESYFRRIGVIPIVVRYEELSVNPVKVASSVLSQLGLSVGREKIYSTMKRQRDDTSLLWKGMFLDADVHRGVPKTLEASV